MEHSVDDVIGKLSEIEATAERILEATDLQKKKLTDDMEERTRQFDEELSKETEEALKQVQVKLNREKDEELKRQREETDELLKAMQQKYDKEHGVWADRILQSIVRM